MKNFCIYILFLLIANSVFAQKDSLIVQYDTNSQVEIKELSNEQLDEYRNDSDFDYTVKKRKTGVFKNIWNWFIRIILNILTWFFGVESATGILAIIIKVVPWLVLAAVLFLIIKFFLKINTNAIITGKTEKAKVILTEDEEIINNKNIEALILKAIEQKNYRLAVRYYYLLVLQKLQDNELIEWEQQKTNEDYIKEIKKESVTTKFKDLTRLYDFVWYGNFEINEVEFAKVETNFNNLTSRLKDFG